MQELALTTVTQELRADLSGLATEELRQQLAEALRITALDFVRLAMIVTELESRGEDLETLKIGILHHLRKIACGQLLPDVVVRFYLMPVLISAIGNLPIPDQQRLASGELVQVAIQTPNGDLTHRLADPLEMTQAQRKQVFAKDHIRNLAEQRNFLDQQQTIQGTASKRTPEHIGQLRIDPERRGVVVARTFVSLSDLEAAVRVLKR